MKNKQRFVLRLFGVLHLAFGALGGVLVVSALFALLRGREPLGRYPYDRMAFYVNMGAEIFFLGGLIIAGVWLLRSLRKGVILTNFILIAEVAYWVINALLPLALAFFGEIHESAAIGIGAVAGISGLGTAAQFVTGYPLIALVALNLARRRLDRDRMWPTAAKSPDMAST